MKIIVDFDIDFKLLKKQKAELLTLIHEKHPDLFGIIHIIDRIQDCAADKYGIDENIVFDLGE